MRPAAVLRAARHALISARGASARCSPGRTPVPRPGRGRASNSTTAGRRTRNWRCHHPGRQRRAPGRRRHPRQRRPGAGRLRPRQRLAPAGVRAAPRRRAAVSTTSGYLERNDFNYLRYRVAHRVTDLPQDSVLSAHRLAATRCSRRSNDHGVRIADAWAIDLFSDRRDGGNEFFEVAGFTPGHDDLVTRGNGVVDVPGKFYLVFRAVHAAQGPLVDVLERALRRRKGSPARPAARCRWTSTRPTSSATTSASTAKLFAQLQPGLAAVVPAGRGSPCAGQGGRDLLGSYRAEPAAYSTAACSGSSARSRRLRIKMETIALDAQRCRGWELAANGEPAARAGRAQRLQPAQPRLPDPLPLRASRRCRTCTSPTCAAASGFRDQGRDVGGLLGDAFSLRDDEQLFVKLSYRFEL